jgi:YadA-like membrane anchor domain
MPVTEASMCIRLEVSMRRIINVVFLLLLVSAPAAAQAPITSPLDPSETYIPVLQLQSGDLCPAASSGMCITSGAGININTLATVTQLNALSTRVDGLVSSLAALGPQLQAFGTRLTALEGQVGALNTNLVEVNNRLATIEDLGKALEGAALAAAVKDALPNPGDRFALRFNAAGASGEFAGAVGFSYNVAERTRVHINYGRSASENAVSGGVNLSFR